MSRFVEKELLLSLVVHHIHLTLDPPLPPEKPTASKSSPVVSETFDYDVFALRLYLGVKVLQVVVAGTTVCIFGSSSTAGSFR